MATEGPTPNRRTRYEGSRHEVAGDLIAKALKDVDFRKQLVNNPKATIARELGINIPSGVNIHIHQETSTEFHLVLPPFEQPDELTDAELETVAGGLFKNTCSECQPAPVPRAVGGVRG
jgi:hypothetical protein